MVMFRHSLLIAALLVWLPLAGCQRTDATRPAMATTAVNAAARPTGAPKAPEAEPPPTTEPLAIAWEALDVGIPAEAKFEPWMMKTSIEALAGRRVRIAGYIHAGSVFQTEGIRELVLLRDSGCPFGRQGEAHHAIVVTLQGDLRTNYTPQPIRVEGIFRVEPYQGPDGSTWSLYALDATRVEPAGVKDLQPKDSLHPAASEGSP